MSAEDGVFDMIQASGTAVAFFKRVRVNPVAVGTPALTIDESIGRIPGGNLGLPPDGDSMDSDSIVNQCSDSHFDFTGRQNFELDPRGCDDLQIAGVGKEWKDGRSR